MFSNSNYKRQDKIDLYDYMLSLHRADIDVYNAWVRLKCNPSVNIRAGRSYWQDFSSCTDDKYGDVKSLLIKFLGYSKEEAIEEIESYCSGSGHTLKQSSYCKEDETERFVMPRKARAYPKTIYAYLGQTRHIPIRLIDLLIAQGYLYMTENKYGRKSIYNVVFTTPDHRFYEIRGCNTYGKAFHQSKAMTENDCLVLPGTKNKPKKIYITEASIDAISLLAIRALNGLKEDALFVALGGIAKTKPIDYLARKYEDAEIILAVDNDKAGDKMREAYKDRFKSIIPKGKDWNDDLCEMFTN